MKMDRRKFLEVSAVSLIIPTLGIIPKIDWSLKFEKISRDLDSFTPHDYKISKGPFSSNMNGGIQDILDSHGLCGTLEIAYMIREEIEYGIDNLKKLYNFNMGNWEHFDSPTIIEARDKLEKQLKRIELSPIEYVKIVLFCHKLRGPHFCCIPQESWEKVEQKLKKIEPNYDIKNYVL